MKDCESASGPPLAESTHSMMEIYPARLRDFSSEEGYSQWHAQCCAIVTLTTGVPEPPPSTKGGLQGWRSSQ